MFLECYRTLIVFFRCFWYWKAFADLCQIPSKECEGKLIKSANGCSPMLEVPANQRGQSSDCFQRSAVAADGVGLWSILSGTRKLVLRELLTTEFSNVGKEQRKSKGERTQSSLPLCLESSFGACRFEGSVLAWNPRINGFIGQDRCASRETVTCGGAEQLKHWIRFGGFDCG